jgi:16S rRNA (adenine1518-N6/adenine1519-N6)-dimethyltransferase
MPFYKKSALQQKLLELGIHLSKKRGQCFLIDENIVDFIIKTANLDAKTDRVLEIGPGLGTITDKLIANTKQLYLIEIDKKSAFFLKNHIAANSNLKFDSKNWSDQSLTSHKFEVLLLHGDSLRVKWPKVDKIVANLPYQISGPLLFKMLENWSYSEVILMIQKEFAERLVAKENTSNYSRLSAAIGYFLKVEILRNVSPQVFFPMPKVTSAIIRVTPKNQSRTGNNGFELQNYYLKLLEGIFPYKNKAIRKALIHFFENFPEFIKVFDPLYQMVQPSQYSGFLKRKVRSFSPEEFMSLIEFGLSGNPAILPKEIKLQ